jgi:hypothetical protein
MDLPFVPVGLSNTGMAKLNGMLNRAGAFVDRKPVIMELGAGYGTFLTFIAKRQIHAECIGIEFCEQRCFMAAEALQSLWGNHDSKKLLNYKIRMIHGDIRDLEDLGPVTVVYSFDEALPLGVWEKLVDLFLASPTCKYLVTFKAIKTMQGPLDRCDMVEHFQLNNETGGKSQCVIVKKRMTSGLAQRSTTSVSSFWPSPISSNKEDGIKYHQELKTKMRALLMQANNEVR